MPHELGCVYAQVGSPDVPVELVDTELGRNQLDDTAGVRQRFESCNLNFRGSNPTLRFLLTRVVEHRAVSHDHDSRDPECGARGFNPLCWIYQCSRRVFM